MFELFDVK